MNLHPSAAYAVHQSRERSEASLRERRFAREVVSPATSVSSAPPPVRATTRRRVAVAAATGTLIVTALGVIA